MSWKNHFPERELYETAHELRHLVNEERREGPGDSRRRRYAHRRRDFSQRLETLLWFVVDEPGHAPWREYIRGGEKPPAPLPLPAPLLFKGS